MMSKPVAVLISDVHYSLPTLELADNAMRQAIAKANQLEVPLIVAGDLHDTKANLRGECVNAMIETFKSCKDHAKKPTVIVGNHDRINEKTVAHSLNFLSPYVHLEHDKGSFRDYLNMAHIIPYHHDIKELRDRLRGIPKGSTIIMHQGLEGSNSGEYIKDKSAITYDDVKDFRVISGHYHARQDIKTGRPQKGAVGLFSYIGNPYTLNFAEANDLPKGFQILMNDGTLEFVPTNLRKHVVIEYIEGMAPISKTLAAAQDLVWVKAKGSRQWLSSLDKTRLFNDNRLNLRLTLEPVDLNIQTPTKTLTSSELLDSLIDSVDTTPETKDRLKSTWKSLCEY